MTASSGFRATSQVPPTSAVPGRLHLCLLDHDGTPRDAAVSAAAFDLPQLIRSAYGVCQHDDMPQGVYARMESRLSGSAGSAGYYYCTGKNGAPFWIAVSIYRTKQGRVVCHMPVSSPQLEKFAAFFAHLKQAERDGLNADESAARLLSLMHTEGVSDYRSLATSIMIEEIGMRDAGQDRPQYRHLLVLQSILKTLRTIDESAKVIDQMSDSSRLIPYQLKLQAARLEGRDGPLSVIADNHQELTQTLLRVTADLQKASSTELDAVIDSIAFVAQSNHAAELLENSAATQGAPERGDACLRHELQEVIDHCHQELTSLLSNIDRSVTALAVVCRRMRRAVVAIEMTTMMCRIERAKLPVRADGLRGIEEQLYLVQKNLVERMAQIETDAATALSLAAQLRRDKDKGAAAARHP